MLQPFLKCLVGCFNTSASGTREGAETREGGERRVHDSGCTRNTAVAAVYPWEGTPVQHLVSLLYCCRFVAQCCRFVAQCCCLLLSALASLLNAVSLASPAV